MKFSNVPLPTVCKNWCVVCTQQLLGGTTADILNEKHLSSKVTIGIQANLVLNSLYLSKTIKWR